MARREPKHGGVIHTYQQYDPKTFPSPTQPPPDMISPAFEHMLMYGSRRELTEEERRQEGDRQGGNHERAELGVAIEFRRGRISNVDILKEGKNK